MKYIQLRLAEPDAEKREILIAGLAEEGFESFEEDAGYLLAYIQAESYTEQVALAVRAMHAGTVHKAEIAQQNWNAEWEAGFEPVHVDGFCTIRADFHAADTNVPYEIIITPKMSFGTGHHATTRLMIQQMKNIDFAGKSVLDFGTGTGVLAILAKKLGAGEVLAIDNDEWSYENTLENIAANKVNGIVVKKGSLELAEGRKFDIILANINRHILLQYMVQMHHVLPEHGMLLMSGILDADEQIVLTEARHAGFKNTSVFAEGKWLCIVVAR
ncbi:MAG: 50S ribosomal protein L11 methyltransferase [Taibaiella sp.]|nr:50S ribosomal protein L11 methyltransferase [Taibaiella sp.]